MPLARLLQALNGTCRHCNQPPTLLQRNHPQCRQTLGAIAQRSHASDQDIERALEEGFRQGVTQAPASGPNPFPTPFKIDSPHVGTAENKVDAPNKTVTITLTDADANGTNDPMPCPINRYEVRQSDDGGSTGNPDWATITGSGASTTSH